jgi:processing peptidase subunit beta
MIFKGTNKRTQSQLEVEIENMGGHLNAYTSREQTVYYAKVFKQDVPRAVEILSDILQGSKLDEAAIERERGVILREMEEVGKMHEEVVFDKLHETAYMGSSLGLTILGPEENIRSITRSQLEEYIQTHYTGPRVVIAGAGGVQHDELVELSDKHFGSLAGPGSAPAGAMLAPPAAPAHFVGSDIRLRDDAMPVAHVAIAMETGGWMDAHSFPISVLQQILGSWDRTSGGGATLASRMCRELSEHSGAHSATTFNTTYSDTGLFGVYFVAPSHGVFPSAQTVMYELARMTEEVTDEELQRAKQQLKTAMLMHIDGTTAVCEDIGRQMLNYGRRMTPAEIFARIDDVDLSSVKKAAHAVIHDKDVAVAALGASHELPDYNWLRRRTFLFRY